MKKLYTYGEHRVFPDKLPWVKKEGWYLTDKEKPAREKKQKQLKFLGWDRDEGLTYCGAEAIIQQILEYSFDELR